MSTLHSLVKIYKLEVVELSLRKLVIESFSEKQFFFSKYFSSTDGIATVPFRPTAHLRLRPLQSIEDTKMLWRINVGGRLYTDAKHFSVQGQGWLRIGNVPHNGISRFIYVSNLRKALAVSGHLTIPFYFSPVRLQWSIRCDIGHFLGRSLDTDNSVIDALPEGICRSQFHVAPR